MILIPAAGNGQRFKDAGYREPKHLIPLAGRTMLDRVTENVQTLEPDADVLVLTRDVVGETRGTAETIARAPLVPPDEPLLIANCDQLLQFPKKWRRGDGVLFTFPSQSAAHSYVLADEHGRISDIVEKRVVSERAVGGVYWFRRASSIIGACKMVCAANAGELYLSEAIRRMIGLGYDLYAVDAPTAILGTPEDLQRFEVALSLAC